MADRNLMEFVQDIKAQYLVGSSEALRMAREMRLQDLMGRNLLAMGNMPERLEWGYALVNTLDMIQTALSDESPASGQYARCARHTAEEALRLVNQVEPLSAKSTEIIARSARGIIEVNPHSEEDVLELAERTAMNERYVGLTVPVLAATWNGPLARDSLVEGVRRKYAWDLFDSDYIVEALNERRPGKKFNQDLTELENILLDPNLSSVAPPEEYLSYAKAYDRAVEELQEHRLDTQRKLPLLWLAQMSAGEQRREVRSAKDAEEVLERELLFEQAILENAKESRPDKSFPNKERHIAALEYIGTQLRRHRKFFDAYLRS